MPLLITLLLSLAVLCLKEKSLCLLRDEEKENHSDLCVCVCVCVLCLCGVWGVCGCMCVYGCMVCMVCVWVCGGGVRACVRGVFQALDALKAALQQEPSDSAVRAELHFSLGNQLREMNDLDRAFQVTSPAAVSVSEELF